MNDSTGWVLWGCMHVLKYGLRYEGNRSTRASARALQHENKTGARSRTCVRMCVGGCEYLLDYALVCVCLCRANIFGKSIKHAALWTALYHLTELASVDSQPPG